ncbi:metal-dependent hydrolase [Halobacteriaceae archaeon GCM10025711]
MDHWLYLGSAVLTHAVVGVALAELVDGPAALGALAGVLPDVDLLFPAAWPFPLDHRGVTHTPAFALAAVVAVALVARGRRTEAAMVAGLGLGSHLTIDTFTASGVMWAYPLSVEATGVAAGVHGVTYDPVFWVLSAVVVAWARRGD